MRRLSSYFLMLFLVACNLNAISETSPVTETVMPTRTLSIEDVESTEDSSQPAIISTASIEVSEESEETCSPPEDWYEYTVARGDTLTSIAQATKSTVDELIAANCLDNPNRIRVGDAIRVPNEPE